MKEAEETEKEIQSSAQVDDEKPTEMNERNFEENNKDATEGPPEKEYSVLYAKGSLLTSPDI